ncbi:GMC family oxidoreductase N-terminal domain-containing protein [Rhizobium sp. Leaf453]|uniref:GMC family oxidoreductase N-terminal domain-containing protein n=1 Tax=Rhizobium sp. Leaf453 TaxID=1736380 RepID=UPI0007135083|nr:GMC family oxidoreductase [Rhizobium sp. Leaf453]KQU08046.1 choline dehydrogenase [Rhizobium sp. Leaf453]
MIFDAIIIGSGFGGAVAACRIAEAGQRVLVLERGRRWSPDDYPRGPDDDWIFDVDEPEEQNGWIDLRFLDDMWVAQGAGVGGGSLIYANVSIDAPKEAFESGWPSQITFAEMAPYYARVAAMLKPEVIPDNQLTPRYTLMRDAAAAIGEEKRLRKLELAVSFDPEGTFPESRPESEVATRSFENAFGRKQGYCVHAGNCDIGCKAQAKNTLDLNYLAVAEEKGAEIRPLAMVSHIVAEGRHYAVVYHEIGNGKRRERVVRTRHVFLAAGSLGSTELLFRSRDLFASLPKVSPALGSNWSSNGDFLTPAFYDDRTLSPTLGPTITAAIDFLDGKDGGARYFVEDGGFPDALGNAIRAGAKQGRMRPGSNFLKMLAGLAYDGDTLENMMPWFGQAVDGGDGRLYYGRDWLRPWRRRLKLDWNVKRSERGIGRLIAAHERLSAATGGTPQVPPTWTVLRNLVTPHPLGGCGMAASSAAGTIDHAGEVFGHPGLYVVDGAAVPRPIGLNPSKTIAALAERTLDIMLRK